MLVRSLKQIDIEHNYSLEYFFSGIKGEQRTLRGLFKICCSVLLPCTVPCSAEVAGLRSFQHLDEQSKLTAVKMEQPCRLLVSNSLGIITAFVHLQ